MAAGVNHVGGTSCPPPAPYGVRTCLTAGPGSSPRQGRREPPRPIRFTLQRSSPGPTLQQTRATRSTRAARDGPDREGHRRRPHAKAHPATGFPLAKTTREW